MTVAVVVFPGSNCEHDVAHALNIAGADAELVWHRETDLSDFDGVVLPGGFAHGDYLRTGAIARFSPIMGPVEAMAAEGKPVLGICNGFQILCEADLLPGVLLQNRDLRFICKPIDLVVTSNASVLTRNLDIGQVLNIPLNSYEGNFNADDSEALEAAGQIVLKYSGPDGAIDEATNPNGSAFNAAAVASSTGNVVGIMPHPERAIESILGSDDGLALMASFVDSLEPAGV